MSVFRTKFTVFTFDYGYPIIYHFCFVGLPVTEELLHEAARLSGVLNVPSDFLAAEFRIECERIIPDVQNLRPDECRCAFLYLKQNLR